jgi:thioredoxin 1
MNTLAGTTLEVTDATFDEIVIDSAKPVLVDFWADWCPPCRMIAPVLKEIAAEQADRLTIAKLDYDANQIVPARYGVLGLPTLLLFKDGEVVKQIVGAKPKRALLKDLNDYL